MYCYYDSRNQIDSSAYIPPSGYYYFAFIKVKLKIVNVANLYMNRMDSVILKLPNREIVYKDSLSIYNFFYMRDTSIIKSVPHKGLLYDAMKSGYYTYTKKAEYQIIKRKPLPDYHSYLKREEDKTIVYYHFVGDSLQQRLTLSEDGTTVLSVESASNQDSNIDRIKFYDINWEYDHFISKEEFETIWKDD